MRELREIRDHDLTALVKRMPEFELSYETITHTKVPDDYDILLAIPQGKKYLVWFTFYDGNDRAIWLHLNKEKEIHRGFYHTSSEIPLKLALGTVLYGTLLDDDSFFVIEDIFYYAGVPLKRANFKEKANFMYLFSKLLNKRNSPYVLPYMTTDVDTYGQPIVGIHKEMVSRAGYPIHRLQCRSFHQIKPYMNIGVSRKPQQVTANTSPVVSADPMKPSNNSKKTHDFDTAPLRLDFNKPQYRYPTVFQVTADLQNDIYHLFAYGFTGRPVYYGLACIPNYRTSVMMNSLFRNIKENADLDAIEDSDDEDDFQNIDEDKHVNLERVLLMECMFHTKWKKWVPVKVVTNGDKRYTHIRRLVQDNASHGQSQNHFLRR
jgi:hypothetical protein